MRNRWDHTAPEGHQDRPRDDTSRYIYAQVSRWRRTYEPIHPEVAMEVAAWWHGPSRADTAVTAFASHGDVKIHGIGGWDSGAGFGPDLGDAVRQLITRHRGASVGLEPIHATSLTCLQALSAYVDAVEMEATRYRRSLWHGGSHRWMGTDTVDEDSCLTCGAVATLRPDSEDGDYGSYFGGDGELINECTGRPDLVHGAGRICEGPTGRGCDEWQASEDGTCEHTEHVCNCNQCCW